MGSFTLEVQHEGSTVSIEPVGTIDLAAARALLAEMQSLRHRAAALVEVRLDRVVAITKSASRFLAAFGMAVVPVPVPYGTMSAA
jgi:hypothetical protein